MNMLAQRHKQILDFVNSTEFKNLDTFYSQPSIFSSLGVSRHENTHSNFIAWLLTPKPEKNNHGLGDLPLRKFLETLALVCVTLPHASDKISPNLANAITSGGYSLSDVSVEREKHIGVGRLDIYIHGIIKFDTSEFPLTIVIENKIRSSEHDSQTRLYQEALNQAVPPSEILLGVFLTPLNNREYESLDSPECESKEFIQLNYQYLADFVISPCRNQAPEGSVKRYLDEYLLALGLPELRQDKGDIIMAISKEERDLLSRFWDKHKDLLIAAMLSMSDSDTLDDSERETIKNASQTLSNASLRYNWKFSDGAGNNGLPKSRLVLEIITHYVQTYKPSTIGELRTKFPDSIQGSFGVFTPMGSADASNFKGHKRYYTDKPVSLPDGDIAVCTQWHKDNIINFIAAAEKLGYVISVSE